MPVTFSNYCGNQKCSHRFPKRLFRKCITLVGNGCSERWFLTWTRSMRILPQDFQIGTVQVVRMTMKTVGGCPQLHGNGWSAIKRWKLTHREKKRQQIDPDCTNSSLPSLDLVKSLLFAVATSGWIFYFFATKRPLTQYRYLFAHIIWQQI